MTTSNEKTGVTEQERFWSGEFGSEYSSRNIGASLEAGKLAMFASIIRRTSDVKRILELGCNVGLNLRVLRQLCPHLVRLTGVEINPIACGKAREVDGADLIEGSLLQADLEKGAWDLSFTSGVLIHIHPDDLPRAYSQLYAASSRYVLVAEYYSTTPVTLSYRGHEGKLFKRDFCGDMLEAYPDLSLVDYGFIYRRDPVFPDDDISWFLMEKRG